MRMRSGRDVVIFVGSLNKLEEADNLALSRSGGLVSIDTAHEFFVDFEVSRERMKGAGQIHINNRAFFPNVWRVKCAKGRSVVRGRCHGSHGCREGVDEANYVFYEHVAGKSGASYYVDVALVLFPWV